MLLLPFLSISNVLFIEALLTCRYILSTAHSFRFSASWCCRKNKKIFTGNINIFSFNVDVLPGTGAVPRQIVVYFCDQRRDIAMTHLQGPTKSARHDVGIEKYFYLAVIILLERC